MLSIFRPAYFALLEIERRVLRPEFVNELRAQRAFRALDWQTQMRESRRRAIEHANVMASASPAYGKRLSELGVKLPITEENWLTLPTLRKADFQMNPEIWLNATIDRGSLSWSSTSGSSGEPFEFPETAASRNAEIASFELNLRGIGWRPGDREGLIKIAPPKMKGLRGKLKQMMGTVPVTFSAVTYRPEDTPVIVNAFNSAGVKFLRSFPTVLLLLSEEMLRRGLRCHIPRIVVFGEGLSASRARVIEEAFQATVYRDYGSSEAMHIGFQCPQCPAYKLDLGRIYVEVLDGVTPVPYGQPGEVVVTCFRNQSFPFVRYRMGDIGVLADPASPCPCGGGVWRLNEIQGRVIDVIYAANGERLDAAYLVVVMEYAHDHVLAYKFIQRAEDHVEVLYVPRHANARQGLEPVDKQLVERVKGAIRFTWTEVKEISSEASGKRKILVPLKQVFKTSIE